MSEKDGTKLEAKSLKEGIKSGSEKDVNKLEAKSLKEDTKPEPEKAYAELEWITPTKALQQTRKDPNHVPTGFFGQPAFIKPNTLGSKFKQNPLVPVGCAATVLALVLGLRSMMRGDSRQSQLMMRARVTAQGFTVAALFGGFLLAMRRSDS